MPSFLRDKIAFLLLTNKAFRLFRSMGVHVTPVNFYSPIPDVRDLIANRVWDRVSDLPGIEMNGPAQLELMERVLAAYRDECDFPRRPGTDPAEFYTQNGYFGYVSAVAMHGMVRHCRPARIVEIGGGHSTKVMARALQMNRDEGFPAELVVVDPYPCPALRAVSPAVSRLVESRVEALDPAELTCLQAGDFLSIDSSHAVRIGGDVAFLYLDILPRLAPGVFVHVHDIFIPENYPRKWLEQRYFWNEQLLLHAFLVGNTMFKVVWGQKYAELAFPGPYAQAFQRVDQAENYYSYSFWFRRAVNRG